MKLLECTCLSQSATVGSISILNIVRLLHVRYKVVSEHPHCMFEAFSDLSAFESMNIFNGYSMKFQWIRLSDQTHHYIKFSLDFRNIFREKREATTTQGPIAIRGIHTRPSDTYLLKWSVLFKFRHVESVKLVEDVSACNLAGPNSMKPVNNGISSSKYPFLSKIFHIQYLIYIFNIWDFLFLTAGIEKEDRHFGWWKRKENSLFCWWNRKESSLLWCWNWKELSFFDAWTEKKPRFLFAIIEKKAFFGCWDRKESSLFLMESKKKPIFPFLMLE